MSNTNRAASLEASLTPEVLEALRSATSNEAVLTDAESRERYGADETEDLCFPPHAVVKPCSTQEVAAVMRICHAHSIPVTPIGARTGLSGGALSVHGGVGLSLEKLNAIVEIDTRNHHVRVQPGVITQVLQEIVAEQGLFYAVDPASRGTCTIGGNLAENSGGPRAVKYGVTKDWVLNLEVVLPNGEVIHTGANTRKNSTGYNLTQLMVGSEGTLGIITEATLKLLPKPTADVLLLIPFASAAQACGAVAAIFQAGITPSALEFMERDALDWTLEHSDITLTIPDEVDAHLLVELDGHHQEVLMTEAERVLEVVEGFGALEVLFADSAAQKDNLWRLRRKVGEAVKAHSVYKEEDTVVPRYALPDLLRAVKAIGKRYGFKSVCYGHAGDGNLHINIIKGDLDDHAWNTELPKAIRELFMQTVALGGTLSGEHGIGWVQKGYMDVAFTPEELTLMRAIKHVFDPTGILNPAKIFPDLSKTQV